MTPSARRALFLDSAAIREIAPGLYTALPESAAAAGYDRKAALYDAIVGRSIYHRVVWGTAAARYRDFGRAALVSAHSEPFAEIGCGSLLFTAEMYRALNGGPAVISDRSLGMLQRAVKRLASAAAPSQSPIALHADAAHLPLASHAFASILMLNVLHVPCDRQAIVAECGRLLMPGRGRLFATCLSRSGRWSDIALEWFHRAGELDAPLTADAVAELLAGGWGTVESFRAEGNMTFVVVRHRG